MSLRGRWTLTIAGFVALGLALSTTANYLIAIQGAKRGAFEWLSGVYRNGVATLNEQILRDLSHDADGLVARRDVAEALSQGKRERLAASIERGWPHRQPQELWWVETPDGEVLSSRPGCATDRVAAAIGGRARAFVMCEDTPVMFAAASERPGRVRLYVGYALGARYADTVRRIAGAEIALLHDGRVVGTTFRDLEGERVKPGFDAEALDAMARTEEHFGPQHIDVASYGGYRQGTEAMAVGASTMDSYVFAHTVDTVDEELPVDIAFAVPRAFMDRNANYSTLALGGASLLIVGLLVLLGGRLVSRLTRPLSRLSAAATSIGQGKADVRVGPTGGGAELDAVGRAFDDMAQRLAELRKRDLDRAEQAAARADELARAHAELEATHARLKEAQAELLAASRQAGMAEVATNVLHNVGNVLNTVNVSADVLRRQLHESKLPSLERAAGLLPEHPNEVRRFLAEDPRSDKLAALLVPLSSTLRKEHEAMEREVSDLVHSVDHLKSVVRSQQKMATYKGGAELIAPAEVLDTAISLQAIGQTDSAIEVVRDYDGMEPFLLDRHRVLQVVVNLLSNARHALRGLDVDEPRIVVRLAQEDQALRIEVGDNGVGIEPDRLDLIFQHGFTTKADGHGFGLHSSANAAREMGGSLQAHSDGPGRGATFVLRVPIRRARRNEAA